jgi:hypothetical protein
MGNDTENLSLTTKPNDARRERFIVTLTFTSTEEAALMFATAMITIAKSGFGEHCEPEIELKRFHQS